MKTLKLLLTASILFSSMLSPSLYAQTKGISKDEWLQQMKTEEQKITLYVNEQLQNKTLTDSIKQIFILSKHAETEENDLPVSADKYVQSFYRTTYFEQHPEALKIYNPGRVSVDEPQKNKPGRDGATKSILCSEGDFETGSLASFAGYWDAAGYFTGNCAYIPTSSVSYTPVALPSGPNDFLITNNVPDPLIPALNQTHNGSAHAIRINSPTKKCQDFGINMLQKSFSQALGGTVKINFSYALVMQNPGHTPTNREAFFVARVLDNTGTEVGSRICVVATDPGVFQDVNLPFQCPSQTVRTGWKDWTCDYIEFDYQAGQTYTIEFFVSGCGWQQHYAYAYVDDICAVTCCPPPPTGLKCKMTDNGNILSWDPVSGAVGYDLVINSNDPLCCKNSDYPFTAVWHVTGTEILVPRSFSPCFSWYVNSVCEDGSVSQTLQKECSCLPECPAPTHLDCVLENDGYKLSWGAIYGALGYELVIHNNDPLCCRNGSVSFMATWHVTGTDTIVPFSFSPCFSWYVNTLCPDSSISETVDKRCSCQPPCTAPINLTCEQVNHGNKLSWDPVPGAVNYKLVIEHNDPLCCKGSSLPFNAVWTVYGTDTIVPDTFTPCFSWYVNTVCLDGTTTNTLTKHCSCGRFPTDLKCTPDYINGSNGSTVSWAPLLGAAYYKVYYVINDPFCCPGGTPVSGMITTAGTSGFVPSALAGCFSWRVVAVMTIGGESLSSETICSCTSTGGKPGKNEGNKAQGAEIFGGNTFATAIPNPASEYIEFEIHNSHKDVHDMTLYLYDMTGREIINKAITYHGKLRIDVQSYPEGIYIYEIRSKNISLFQDKVVIKKQ